ncbi:MAG: hypothetical protein AAF682_07145 [Planctomycetota bacterium]
MPAPRTRLALAAGLASIVAAACSSSDELDELPPPPIERVPNVELRRPGFRLLHPESWSVDVADPAYDPDRFFFLQGPEGAAVALMILDEPADPAALVETMSAEHGLEQPRVREFTSWGRFDGAGVDVHGLSNDLPSGLRAFAWSSDTRSFLVTESYYEYGYASARAGFEAVEMSFALLGDDTVDWPDISLGTPVYGEPEKLLVRGGFQLRFPDDWAVDFEAPDYDPDRFFALASPYDSCWVVVQVLEQGTDPAATLADAVEGLRPILSGIDREQPFDRWGSIPGQGLELGGAENGLDATLRVFCASGPDRTLVVTEFWYDELAPKVEAGFALISSSFVVRLKEDTELPGD